MTKYVVILAIMNIASAVSDVNDPKEKVCFGVFKLKVTKRQKKVRKKYI